MKSTVALDVWSKLQTDFNINKMIELAVQEKMLTLNNINEF